MVQENSRRDVNCKSELCSDLYAELLAAGRRFVDRYYPGATWATFVVHLEDGAPAARVTVPVAASERADSPDSRLPLQPS